ncbi:MAG: gliding motility-associated C-terminal domain-containing protein, partial [Saprospiraceae bacterium]|nr:gliding motility-associated C-terminal domain-containing protein [Saprospiraceae bacterium]
DNLVRVYNRWGNLVFEQKGYRGTWDGTWNERDLPDGTYYYLIDLGDGQLYSGFLQINR